jgi:hypothetical protein
VLLKISSLDKQCSEEVDILGSNARSQTVRSLLCPVDFIALQTPEDERLPVVGVETL